MLNRREISIDMMKGILIVCVVIGHNSGKVLHDIIYMFHMPLFFIISGFLLKKDKILSNGYLKNKAKQLLVPYWIYIIFHFFLVKKEYSFKGVAKVLWGGRLFNGTYWYITCFLFALYLFTLLLKKKYSNRKNIFLIILSGVIAVIESNLIEYVDWIRRPGIPWNLDAALLALVYIAIGYYGKTYIRKWMLSKEYKYDIVAGIALVLITIFCYLNIKYRFYYFDMKPIYYKELILSVIVPCVFGVVIVRLIWWMEKVKFLNYLNKGLVFLGKNTLPIMFIHAPLNTLIMGHFQYGRVIYVIIGIGVPVLFTLIFSRFIIMRKLFGLPELN